MKKLIIAILLISAVAALAFEPFVLEPIVPKKYKLKSGTSNAVVEVPVADYLQIQRNFDKIARKIRETEYRADSMFVQTDTNRVDGSGYKIIQLPYKYANTDYFAASGQQVNTHIYVGAFTDSSIVVMATDFDYVATGGYFNWVTIGIRKK